MQPIHSDSKQPEKPASEVRQVLAEKIPVPTIVPTGPLSTSYFSTPTAKVLPSSAPQLSLPATISKGLSPLLERVAKFFNLRKNP